MTFVFLLRAKCPLVAKPFEVSRDCTQEGKWILDFNQAYNPWCAYSEAYTCPFVPVENWLEVPILAGEKNTSFK